jgi:hypothetical protein
MEASPARAALAARSWFNGWIACMAWPREAAAHCLPSDLALAPAEPRPDVHPVVFFFGEQTATSLLFGGLVLPTGTSFRELGIAIPFVRVGRQPDLHIYVPGIYASYLPTVWVGNAHYGFAKTLAQLSWQGGLFVVTTPDGRLLGHAEVEASGPWTAAPAGCLPVLDAVHALFTAFPVIGRRTDGALVISRFAWDLGDASARPADTCVSLVAAFPPAVPPGRYPDLPGGSVEIRGLVWDLAWPTRWPGG